MHNSRDLPPVAVEGFADMLNDCSIDRVMAIDTSWRIIAWNKTSASISGLPKEEVYGKKLLEVFPAFAADPEMMQALNLAMAGTKTAVPAYKDHFNRHYYENHFIPLKDQEGHIIGVLNIMHDVAHRLKAEQELQRLNIALKKKYEQLERANEELSTFTYITTHNIREPLRQFYSFIEILIRTEAKALSDSGKASLRRMQGSLSRMNLQLDDIVALARINSLAGDGIPIKLNEVLQEAITKQEEKLQSAGVQVTAGDLPTVIGHHDMLYYLCYYLLGNAIRFRKPNQQLNVTIKSEQVLYPAREAEQLTGRSLHKVSFIDNGAGFQQEDAESMFMMAHQTPQQQAGAGLAICRKIMLTHDGFIEAEGWPGNGAAFHCYFPVHKN